MDVVSLGRDEGFEDGSRGHLVESPSDGRGGHDGLNYNSRWTRPYPLYLPRPLAAPVIIV
jgi:hypothetical protein